MKDVLSHPYSHLLIPPFEYSVGEGLNLLFKVESLLPPGLSKIGNTAVDSINNVPKVRTHQEEVLLVDDLL